MNLNQLIWERIRKQLREKKEEGFEEIYILTYQQLYRDVIQAVGREEKAEKILVDFYVRVYEELGDFPNHIDSEEEALQWLESILYEFFEIQPDGRDREDILAKRISEERATTLFFEIEDRLGIQDADGGLDREQESSEKADRRKRVWILLTTMAGILVLALAGSWKVRSMIQEWDASMKVDLTEETAFNEVGRERAAAAGGGESESQDLTDLEETEEETEEKEETDILNVAGWEVEVDEEGRILDSRRGERVITHGSVQSRDSWEYMLLNQDAFPDMEKEMEQSLIRISGEEAKEYQLLAEGVEDFVLEGEKIYYATETGVRAMDLEELNRLEPIALSEEIRVKGDGFYLLNELGWPEKAGQIQDGDRILRVEDGKIRYVTQAARTVGGRTFYLAEADGDMGAELCCSNGSEAWVFQKGNIWIDSFCTAGDWIYFSAYEERDEAGRRYSSVYRVKADGTGLQNMTGLFQGNVTAMYYFADQGAIYGEFKPDSYHSYYGQIVRISLDGGMQVYDSREARSAYQTTGDDVLELIAVEDGKIYCYWHDCSVSGGQASILWTRPLVLG